MYFKAVILHCHQKMQKERSISGTYYLLQGKPSIQTIQDGQIYQLNQYFGLYKKLPKQRFFQIVQNLVEQRLLEKQNQENFYVVTNLGELFITNYFLESNYLQGDKFHHMDELFFQRILLFVQVFTNSKMNNMKFIPIIENREVEIWLKPFYKKWKHKSVEILKTFYDEIIRLLTPIENIYAEIFVEQLTGYKRFGLTIEQIAYQYKLSVEDVYLLHINTIHYILQTLENEQSQYPLLYCLSKDLLQQGSYTNSAKITKSLIDSGLTLQEIARKRRLRLNTIYDHVVEIALKERDFQISKFVTKEAVNEIVQAIQALQSYKLKEIKNAVRDEISYFQIRLVLAKFNQIMKESESS